MDKYDEIHQITQKKIVKIDDDDDNNNDNIIRISEKITLETAGRIWESALILGKYLMKKGIPIKQKCILDMGCGTGILSILMASQGANVIATDLPQVEHLCVKNIEDNQHIINNNNGCVTFRILDWNQPKNKTIHQSLDGINIDYILASDVSYSKEAMESFLSQLVIIYSISKPITYLAHKCRHDDIDNTIEDRFEQMNFWWKLIDYKELDEIWRIQSIRVYEIGMF